MEASGSLSESPVPQSDSTWSCNATQHHQNATEPKRTQANPTETRRWGLPAVEGVGRAGVAAAAAVHDVVEARQQTPVLILDAPDTFALLLQLLRLDEQVRQQVAGRRHAVDGRRRVTHLISGRVSLMFSMFSMNTPREL